MFIRPYTFLDYTSLEHWATLRKFPLLPPDYLPKTGFIVPGHCIGFLYETDTPITWLEWVISNPEAKNDEALNLLIETACSRAKELGYKMIFTSLEHKGLIERYKQHEFIATETGMTNMMRKL